jgi:hypothetical protein
VTEEPAQCKHEGCLQPAVDRRGRYAGLCEFHKNQKRHLTRPVDELPATNGHRSRVELADRLLHAAMALADAEAEYDAALNELRKR